jgi:hypothetical protein
MILLQRPVSGWVEVSCRLWPCARLGSDARLRRLSRLSLTR